MGTRTIYTVTVEYQTKQGELERRNARSAMCEHWRLREDGLLILYRVVKFRLEPTEQVMDVVWVRERE